MSLTGGLDTRIIMAHARRPPETFPCYTFGSMYRDSFDVRIARKVAKTCRQKHFTIRVGKEYLSQFQNLAEKAVYITDGYLDAASGSTELYLNKIAREIAPIRITGNYGSEVLRSIIAFRYRPPNRNLFDEEISKNIYHASGIFDENTKGNKLSFTVFKQAPWFSYNRASLEQSQLTVRTPFMDNELVRLVYMAPKEAVTNDRISLQLVTDGNIDLSRIITNRGAGGNCYQFLSRSMQVYYEILHLAEIGYDYGMPHWLSQIDDYLVPFCLGKLFLGRNNFSHFRIWFRNELSDYIKEILLDKKTTNRPYLNKGFLEKMVNAHISGKCNYVREINTIITLELIHRLLIEDI
jgi:asparagine synthase (glutamine-hydrolysing)